MGRLKNIKTLTSESILEPTRFDQSESFTCKKFQFIDFFKIFFDLKLTPTSYHSGDGLNLKAQYWSIIK